MSGVVMVVGAGGFIGAQVVKAAVAAGHRVIAVGGSGDDSHGQVEWLPLRLPDEGFGVALARHRPWLVLHAASRSSVPASMQDPAGDLVSSVGVTSFVLEALRRQSPESRVIVCSSAAVYGSPASLPISETAALAPLSPYGYHKWMTELLVRQYAQVFGLNACSLRIFSAYGPGLRRQLLWDICCKLRRTGRLELQGTGRESRDFIHVDDVARAVFAVADRGAFIGESINVASGSEVTVLSMSVKLMDALGIAGAPVFSGYNRPGDPLQWRADITALARLGFIPQVGLDEGVAAYARWAWSEVA
jgi:UDP-glucose 4-epimerase